jgi:outer membrane biosynthesis protein TonB
MASAESKPAPAPARSAYVSTSSETGGLFGKVKSFFTGDDEKPAQAAPVASAPPKPAPKPAPKPQPATAAAKPQPAAQGDSEQTAQTAPTPARQSAASGASLMSGASPTVPAGSFDQRWGAIR